MTSSMPCAVPEMTFSPGKVQVTSARSTPGNSDQFAVDTAV